jgi:hypothetical protein
MENARRQHRIRAALFHAIGEMLQVAHATAGDNRDLQHIRHRTGQRQVEAGLLSIPVHAGQQYLTGAQALHPFRPLYRIQTGRLASAVRVHFPMIRPGLFGIDRHHDAL